MQRAPWDLLLAFSALRVHPRPLCRLLPIQSFPAASRLLGPYHSVSKLQCYAAMMPWMLCIGSSALCEAFRAVPGPDGRAAVLLNTRRAPS